jgi:hypothetical protein
LDAPRTRRCAETSADPLILKSVSRQIKQAINLHLSPGSTCVKSEGPAPDPLSYEDLDVDTSKVTTNSQTGTRIRKIDKLKYMHPISLLLMDIFFVTLMDFMSSCRLTSWRRYSPTTPYLHFCHVHAAFVWGYVFYGYGHFACKSVNSGTTIFM